jgi:hypothetical protein
MRTSRWLIAGLAFVSLCGAAAAAAPAAKPQRVLRWTPGRGTDTVASLEWKFRVFGTSNLVAPGGVILWHFGEETADSVGLAPWRIDLETGRGQPLRQEAFFSHEVSAQWLPGGKAVAVNPQRIEVRNPAGQSLRTIAERSGKGFVVSFAVNPFDGRIAGFQEVSPEAGVVDLVIWSAGGEELVRIERITRAPTGDGFTQPFYAVWLPAGRLAFAPPLEPDEKTDTPWRTRHLALVDVAQRKVARLPIFLSAIHDASPNGLLLDGGRLYDLASGKVLPHPQPSGDPIEGQRFSPDGSWLAGLRGGTVGVLRLSDRTWHSLSPGEIIGWDSDGALYWLEDPS